MEKGVMTLLKSGDEKTLKTWWENYSKHNAYPVTFCDLGIDEKTKKWCASKGSLLTVSKDAKNTAFLKVEMLLKSPYDKTIWTDLDCEIRKDLAPLYEMSECKDGFAISYDTKASSMQYEGGVFAFKKGSPFVDKWRDYCIKNSSDAQAEQNGLKHLCNDPNLRITILSSTFNWQEASIRSPHAAIYRTPSS